MDDGKRRCAVGVDLGGTNTALGIVDSRGNILVKTSFPTSFPTAEEWAARLAEEIRRLSSVQDNVEIAGIGIGAPCANPRTGNIEGATDMPWRSERPLVRLVEERCGLPAGIINDANTAAMGEMAFGEARGLSNFIVLTLGTGVGAGVVVDGHCLSGTRGFASELGHVTFPFASTRKCTCGRMGCLQTVAAASGVVETARRLLGGGEYASSLAEVPVGELTSKMIAEAAAAGDPLAQEVFRYTGECLGKAAAEFAAFADPEAIILFGGVAKAGDLLLKPMRESFEKNALHLYRGKVRFAVSSLPGGDAAILGAAGLVI